MKLHPRLSAEAVVLARRGERLRAQAERDGRGWVVGYGHRAGAREGARVGEADALALLVYDLSRSADEIAPLLPPGVSPALFDALNAYALRVGPGAFARSPLLARVNAGEAVTAAEALAARDAAREGVGKGAGEDAPSAVLAAAAAVRDRVSQVLDAPPSPPPPRPPLEPWREPAALEPPAAVPGRGSGPAAAATDAADEAPFAAAASPPSPPIPTPEGLHEPPSEPGEEPAPPPFLDPAPSAPAFTSPPPADRSSASAASEPRIPPPRVERGVRFGLWDRWRGDPRLYMAVGACGLVLFLCAFVGSLMGRPTAYGLALGLVGVICLAPATAFFLHRRTPPG